MKLQLILKGIAIVLTITVFQSCYKPGKIQVENNTKFMMENVRWGDVIISERILSGETSKPVTIKKSIEKLPATYGISFKSHYDGKDVFSKTRTTFTISQGESRSIRIDNDTPMYINVQ